MRVCGWMYVVAIGLVLVWIVTLVWTQSPDKKSAQVQGFADAVKATQQAEGNKDKGQKKPIVEEQKSKPIAVEGQKSPPILTDGQESKSVAKKPLPSASQSQLVETAKRYLGKRYRRASSSPSRGFDCSGFVYYLLRTYGLRAPRTAAELYQMGEPVSRSQLRSGDLVFFRNTARRHGITHVGIYIGNGKFIHSSSARGRVIITNLSDPYYAARFVGVRRLPSLK